MYSLRQLLDVTGHITLFTDAVDSVQDQDQDSLLVKRRNDNHSSDKRAIFLLYNDIKHMVKGNDLAELHAQIHAPVIDTGLLSCDLCFAC